MAQWIDRDANYHNTDDLALGDQGDQGQATAAQRAAMASGGGQDYSPGGGDYVDTGWDRSTNKWFGDQPNYATPGGTMAKEYMNSAPTAGSTGMNLMPSGTGFQDPVMRWFGGDDPAQAMRKALGSKYNFNYGASPATQYMERLAAPLFWQYVAQNAAANQDWSPEQYRDKLAGGQYMQSGAGLVDQLQSIINSGLAGGELSPIQGALFGIGQDPSETAKFVSGLNYFRTPGALRDNYSRYVQGRLQSLGDQETPPENFLGAMLGMLR